MSYLMADLAPEAQCVVKQLELALETPTDGRIVLWDDFCGRAGHSITALCQWLGIRDERMLNEYLADPLSKERRESFLTRRITICFALGLAAGIEELRAFLREKGLANVDVLAPCETVPETGALFDGALISEAPARADLVAFLQKTSRDVLGPRCIRTDREKWSPEVLESRLLGYGNKGHLLAFFYNVPSITLTPLWAWSEKWVPLFRRREKLSFPLGSPKDGREPSATT